MSNNELTQAEWRAQQSYWASQNAKLDLELAALQAQNTELLTTLQDIVRAEWTTVTLQDMTPQHRNRLEKARAAIAKAEGRT